MLGHGQLQTDKHTDGAKGVCSKRRPRDARRLRGRDVSVSCGHLDVFQETPFRLALRGKVLAMASSLWTNGHMRRLKRFLRYIPGMRDMHLELVRPREQLVGWCDGSWADLDEKRRSTTGSWSRTRKPTALSSDASEFCSGTVCACDLLWTCDFL